MRKNLSVHWDTIGEYATDLFTRKAIESIKSHDKTKPMFMLLTHLAPHAANDGIDEEPLQAPQEEFAKFDYIKDEDRRKYAAMISKVDSSIGQVVKALDDNEMLANSVVLFFSDNGAPVRGNTKSLIITKRK